MMKIFSESDDAQALGMKDLEIRRSLLILLRMGI